jgi:hypothetical protein
MIEPDWLKRRDGILRQGLVENTFVVVLKGEPQYRIVASPASGKFTCFVIQTMNGKRLDQSRSYPDAEAAIKGGLDELREKLGW